MSKTFSLVLAVFAATASVASAESYFQNMTMEHDRGGHIEVGLVRADAPGVVEIYSYHQDKIGILLGSTTVNAGANTHVHVNVNRPWTDAIAILKINGQTVDMEEIRIE